MNCTKDGENNMNKNRSIRVGKINFANVWPVFYDLDLKSLGEQIKIITEVPTKLNEGMKSGDIDISPISSFSYAESFDQYMLLPDLSVSSYGKVNSIYLF